MSITHKKNSQLLVNLGCGSRIHPSWMNLDMHAAVPGVIVCDLTKGIPVGDSEANVVYSAAVLEHIRPIDVPFFFSEAFRVLKPGGILRIGVPDLELQAREYLAALNRIEQGDSLAILDREWMVLEMIDQTAREKSGGKMLEFLSRDPLPNEEFVASRVGQEGSKLMAYLRQSSKKKNLPIKDTPSVQVRFGRVGRSILKKLLSSTDIKSDLHALEIGRFRLQSGEVHHWAYDKFSLRQHMERAGFNNPVKCNHGKSKIDGWENYFLEISKSGNVEKPDLLVVECEK